MQNKRKKFSVKQLVIIAMLSSISIFLGISGLGFIVLPAFKLTIMHIPVIIGAIIEGPMVGALVGLIFGLFSMYQNFTVPGPTSFIFWNPIIALIPRVLIGISAYYIYTILKNKFKNKSIPIGIAAVCATLINTIGVLGMTYLFYIEKYSIALNISPELVGTTLLGVGVTNGIPEAILSALISIPIVSGLKKIRK